MAPAIAAAPAVGVPASRAGQFSRRRHSLGSACATSPASSAGGRPDILARPRGLRYVRRAPVNSPGDGIAWVPLAPPRLPLLPGGGLPFWRVAGPLPISCSRTRPEPPAADPAWSLPGLWHRDDLSLSSRAGSPRSTQNAWVTLGE